MKTVSLLSIVIALSASAFAVSPASASVNVAGFCDGGRVNEDVAQNPDRYANLLKSEGFNVSGVTEWGGCIRAFMTDANGHQSMVFFDPLTLQELTAEGSKVSAS